MLASTAPQIYAMAAVLVALALGLIVYGIRLVRVARHDPPALAPLEAMGTRAWRRSAAPADVEPADAEPVDVEPVVGEPVVGEPGGVEAADITSAIEDVPPVVGTVPLDGADLDDVEVVEVVEGVAEHLDDAAADAVATDVAVADIEVVEVLDTAAES